jgi:protein-S-isoprenylcysteine O-methyltransferase Ste14
VRIQADRGHAVVDSGPYALVRHPLYVGAVLMFTGVALALGSWWALFPVGMVVVILLVRTALEDRTLRNELPGYQAYAQRVRYKLIPGIW